MLKPLRKQRIFSYSAGCHDWVWQGPEIFAQSYFGHGKVKFLSLEGTIVSASDWNNSDYEKLWLYNLHYFDDLVAIASLSRREQHLQWVKQWINDNALGKGNGWEPYPISLRLVNWIKWYKRAGVDDEEICKSIASQAAVLCNSLEYHILGNHLFANAKALIFAGCFLKDAIADKCLALGISILQHQLPEQFLKDGGHFERSPMYHEILLWDLLDLINLAQLSGNKLLGDLINDWSGYAQRALDWLNVMTHPDGEVSFFNDSAFGIAATSAQIFDYAKSLNLNPAQESLPLLTTLQESGYSRVNMPLHSLIFDHAALGPSYLLGHAHADTLSIEWSVGLERVLVNSGTSVYGVSKERLRQRQTAAHNTVSVDNQDSSEVWSGFRVARCAHASLETARIVENTVSLVGSHDGYKRLKGKVLHRREIAIESDLVSIKDSLVGHFNSAETLFHLHPNIEVNQISSKEILLILASGKKVCLRASDPIAVVESTWHPRFGESIPNKKLCIRFVNLHVDVCFSILR
ncbi:MAG: alginate lyase family protein [Pseudomonadota bacterium]